MLLSIGQFLPVDTLHTCQGACRYLARLQPVALRPSGAACRKPAPGRSSWCTRRAYYQSARSRRRSVSVCAARTETEGLQVTFRKVDTFDLWIWLELAKPPTAKERELLEYVFESWYALGRLGGFNTLNLQVFEKGEVSVSGIKYDQEKLREAGRAYFHELGPLEERGSWCRVWVNMGTGDEFALDVLINALDTFSREELPIRQLIIGGVNKEWPVPKRADPLMEGLPKGMDTQDL